MFFARTRVPCFVRKSGLGWILQQDRAWVPDVDLQRVGGAAEQRDDAVLAAFAVADEEHALPEIDVGEIESFTFADTTDRHTPPAPAGNRFLRHRRSRRLTATGRFL